MNNKVFTISTLSSSAIIAIVMVFTFAMPAVTFDVSSNYDDALGTYSENLPIRAPAASPLLEKYGQSIDKSNIQFGLDFIQTEPKVLPSGIELKGSFAESNNESDAFNMIMDVYLPNNSEISKNTTFRDVMDIGGFIIIQSEVSPNVDKQHWIDNFGNEQGAKYSTIGESKVIIADRDGSKGERSQLYFYNGEVLVNLVSVALNADELLKIANSMN